MLDVDFYDDKFYSKFFYPREYAIVESIYNYGVYDDNICYLKNDDEPIMYVFKENRVVRFTIDENKSWLSHLIERDIAVNVRSLNIGEIRKKNYTSKKRKYIVSFEFDGEVVVLDQINDCITDTEGLYISQMNRIIEILGI
ncbi:Uncharacterised protein [uncultured Clostridium sp.]|uniref:hypothetical protein n=1 Tax=uncultured Clostridium sp. TaxID=59620 RepID=UPI000822C37E|nr:hypothetical protein [uncultured Clostridium sp.]SCK03188.1 Uncharacterised protein [uncultured Clostridium sp.]